MGEKVKKGKKKDGRKRKNNRGNYRTVFEGMKINNIRIVGNGKGSGGGEDNEDLDDILENISENFNF